MGAVGAQALPNHETGLGIQVCWRKAFHTESNIEITRDLPVNEMELIRCFPDVSSTSHDVPAISHLPNGTRQLRRTNIKIGKVCGCAIRGSS